MLEPGGRLCSLDFDRPESRRSACRVPRVPDASWVRRLAGRSIAIRTPIGTFRRRFGGIPAREACAALMRRRASTTCDIFPVLGGFMAIHVAEDRSGCGAREVARWGGPHSQLRKTGARCGARGGRRSSSIPMDVSDLRQAHSAGPRHGAQRRPRAPHRRDEAARGDLRRFLETGRGAAAAARHRTCCEPRTAAPALTMHRPPAARGWSPTTRPTRSSVRARTARRRSPRWSAASASRVGVRRLIVEERPSCRRPSRRRSRRRRRRAVPRDAKSRSWPSSRKGTRNGMFFSKNIPDVFFFYRTALRG